MIRALSQSKIWNLCLMKHFNSEPKLRNVHRSTLLGYDYTRDLSPFVSFHGLEVSARCCGQSCVSTKLHLKSLLILLSPILQKEILISNFQS